MLDALSFRCCLSDGSTWHFSPFAKVPRTKFCTKDMGVLSSSQKISLIQPSVALTPLVNHNPQATVLLVWYANMLLYQSKTREKLLIILCAYELAGHPNAHSSYDKRSSLAYSLYLVLYSFHSLYIDNKHQSKCLQLSKVMTSISSINASITSLLGNSDIIRKHNELETILTFLLYCLYHFGSAALQDDKVVCSFGIIGQINSTGLGGGAKYISSKVHFWTTASTLDRSWVNPPKTNATW